MPQPKRINTPYECEVIQTNTAEEAARLLGLSRSTITKICRVEGISFVRKCEKTSAEQRRLNRAIKEAYQSGMSIGQIALKLDVYPWRIRRLLRIEQKGPIYKHLTFEVLNWLDRECPEKMDIHEFTAIIIREAYEEDQE